MQMTWLPDTCPSTSVRFPNAQEMPTDRSGASLTTRLSCGRSKEAQEQRDDAVGRVLRAPETGAPGLALLWPACGLMSPEPSLRKEIGLVILWLRHRTMRVV